MEYFDWTLILLDLIVTVIGFLLIPVFIRLFIGKLPTKKAKKIAIINGIIVQIIFIIIITGISDNPRFNFIPAIVWGCVGYAILNNGEFEKDSKKICPHCNYKNNSKRETCFMCGKLLIEKKDENEQENIDIESKLKSIEESIDNLHSESRYTYCGKCGAKNNDDDKFCTTCGQPLSHIDKNSISPLKKEDLQSKENLEVTSKEQIKTNQKEFSTVWLTFVTILWLISGLILSVYSGIMIIQEDNELGYFIDFIRGVLAIIIFIYVSRRVKIGYYLFILNLIINLFVNIILNCLKFSNSLIGDASFLCALIGALLWFIPNMIYISKRKSIFGIDEDEI